MIGKENVGLIFFSIGIALSSILSFCGAIKGVAACTSSLMGSIRKKERPSLFVIVNIIFCELIAIYGLLISIIGYSKMKYDDKNILSENFLESSILVLAGGIINGTVNFECGKNLGSVAAISIVATQVNKKVQSVMIICLAFNSTISLFGFIISMILVLSIK